MLASLGLDQGDPPLSLFGLLAEDLAQHAQRDSLRPGEMSHGRGISLGDGRDGRGIVLHHLAVDRPLEDELEETLQRDAFVPDACRQADALDM